MAEELGERTEEATPRRLSEARRRGQVARSQDLASAVDLIGAMVLLVAFAGLIGANLGRMMERTLSLRTPGDPLSVDAIRDAAAYAGGQALRAALPVLLLMVLVAFLGQAIQVRWLLTLEPLKPKLTNLNPVTGLRRLFSRRNLVKTVVNTGKLLVVAGVALAVMHRHKPRLPGLVLMELPGTMLGTARMLLELIAWLLAVMLVIGVIDYLYQRWQYRADLRMTRQEVKDERKSMDGDPEVKKRRMRMAAQIALQRIRSAVPKADVVVSNPTHVAVALRYDASTMRAPRVTAKGADLLALRIREVALAHGVPVVERPPLARALYFGVAVGQEVRPEHYEAVAEVLAYVYRLEGRHAAA